MKKRLAAIVLATAMVMAFLTGCSSSSSSSDSSDETEEEAEEEEEEEEDTEEEESDDTESVDSTDDLERVIEYSYDYSDIDVDDLKIALIGSTSGGNFWGNIESGFTAMCEENGWTGVYWAPSSSETGDAAILDLAETALTQGYDVIVPVINEADMFEDFLTRAAEAGTLVIAYNADPGEEYVIAQLGIDSYQSGHQQGEKIAQFANEMGLEEINYITMMSSTSMSSQQLVKQGALDAIAENFDGEVNELGEGESEDNAATAQDAIGSLLIAHSEVNVIICADQYSAVGAGQYIEENGREGEIIACGLSLDSDALIRVKSGSLSATSSVDSVTMGGTQLGDLVKAIINGEDYEYNNYPEKIWVLPEEVDEYAEANDIDLG